MILRDWVKVTKDIAIKVNQSKYRKLMYFTHITLSYLFQRIQNHKGLWVLGRVSFTQMLHYTTATFSCITMMEIQKFH